MGLSDFYSSLPQLRPEAFRRKVAANEAFVAGTNRVNQANAAMSDSMKMTTEEKFSGLHINLGSGVSLGNLDDVDPSMLYRTPNAQLKVAKDINALEFRKQNCNSRLSSDSLISREIGLDAKEVDTDVERN